MSDDNVPESAPADPVSADPVAASGPTDLAPADPASASALSSPSDAAPPTDSASAPADPAPASPAAASLDPAAAAAPSPSAVLAFVRRHADPLIGLGLASSYVAWLLATARSLGFARDEGFYFSAASTYEHWFKVLLETPKKALERGAIDGAWSSNHEHPSLMKSLFAISHMLFHEKWKVFHDASTAFRFPGMLMMGLALFVTYLFAARAYSRRAGVVAAVALGLMPRVFYNAHLACFDVAIMAMWTSCVYVYWRAEGGGLQRESFQGRRPDSFGWALFAGVVYGLTLETKHNAWILPAVFVPHALVLHGRAMMRSATRTNLLPIPVSLLAMATVGPAVFLLLWPWLWHDTIPRIQEYVNFHVHHDYYNMEFLGRTYFGPPSPKAYMPVMIFATVPTATLVLFAVGAFDRIRARLLRIVDLVRASPHRALAGIDDAVSGDRAETDLLIFLAFALPLAPFLLPTTPIFGGTKHWIPAYPFLAMLAGRGFDVVVARTKMLLQSRASIDEAKLRPLPWLLGACAFSGALLVTVHSHPFGLSSYVPIVGGTAGGADLGLNRQFWGFTTESLAPYFEKNTKPGDRVYYMDTAPSSWSQLIAEKRIPTWLRGVSSPASADFSIVHHEQHMNEVDYNIWTEYGSSTPDYVLTHDGVPIITVYKRDRTGRE